MIRVLDSRRKRNNRDNDTTQRSSSSSSSLVRLQRKERPIVLQTDIDGAQRVLSMLRHMMELNVATERSFQIAMDAFVQRGRLRWRKDDDYDDTHGGDHNNDNNNNDNNNDRRRRRRRTTRASTNVICAADQLECLLRQLECYLNGTANTNTTNISIRTYNMVLEGYANCATPRGGRNYAYRAQALLDRMENRYDVHSLAHTLHAWAWQQSNKVNDNNDGNVNDDTDDDDDDVDCCPAQRAHELLQQIQNEYYNDYEYNDNDDIPGSSSAFSSSHHGHHLYLLMQCYDYVLEAWSKCKLSDGSAPERATAIFDRMKCLKETVASRSDDDDDDIMKLRNRQLSLPNAESYTNVILSWAKCTSNTKEDRESDTAAAERATALLEELIERYKDGTLPPSFSSDDESLEAAAAEPEHIAFSACIVAWARLGRPDMAERILWQLHALSQSTQRLTIRTENYNSVLHAHVKSDDKQRALRRIIDIVRHMEDCEAAAKDDDRPPAIAPDGFTYNTLMKAWVQSGEPDAPEQAEAILWKMEQLATRPNSNVKLTNRNFNVVINAYAKSSKDDRWAATRAHRLLERMEEASSAGGRQEKVLDVEPDIITYTSVLECLSKSSDPNAPSMAEALLERAFERYERTEKPSMMPNLRTFTMAIQVLAQCPRRGNAVKARGLLMRLIRLYESTQHESLRPNAYPYNYVINCAANTIGTMQDKIEAFQVATRTYQEMRNSSYTLVQPDSYTYGFWIKACNNLLPQASDIHSKCVSIAIQDCKRDGVMTNEVLNRLQQGSSRAVVQSLLLVGEKDVELGGRGRIQVENLPPNWSRNVQQRNVRRRSR